MSTATIPSRTTDPSTSHEAAAAVAAGAASARRQMLTGFSLIEKGNDEQAAEAAGVSLTSEYCKRASELRAAGYIEALPGERIKGKSGMARQVSQITQRGLDALESDEPLDSGSGGDTRWRERAALKVLRQYMVIDTEGSRFGTDKTKAERHQREFFRELREAWGVDQ